MDTNTIERQSSAPGLISGAMLVIVTAVGGRMSSLPIAMVDVWFLGASVTFLFIAIMVLLAGLMLIEASLHYGAGVSSNTFTQDLLGRKWNIVIGIVFDFMLYILTHTYISGSSATVAQIVFKYSGVHFPANISVAIVNMLVGVIAWYSSLLVGRITTVLIIGKSIALFATFSGLVGHIGVAELVDSVAVALPSSQYPSYILITLPLCIISFGFHDNTPSLVELYGKSGVLNVTRLIIIGTPFALLLYIFWLGVTMDNISRSTSPPTIAKGDNIDIFTEAISELFTSRYMNLILTFFGNFAVASSLLAATLGLFDYTADLSHFPDGGVGCPKTTLMTYFPSAAVYFFLPNGFVHATGYAGLAFTIWNVVLPPFLVKAAWKRLPTTGYTVPHDNIVLNLMIVCGAVVYLMAVLDVFGLLPTFRQTESR